MNFGNYTQKSLEAIRNAQQIAVENYNQQMEQCHILVALLRQEQPRYELRWRCVELWEELRAALER
jgi:ATP-dependent Clp protease ATP-binding subunit ClpA